MDDIKRIEKLIADGEKLKSGRATRSKPEFTAWHTTVARFLTRKYGEGSVEYNNFRSRPFGPTAWISGVAHDDSIECASDISATILELKSYLEEGPSNISAGSKKDMNKIFIVHGHNGELRESVARLLEKQNITPIILNEEANLGRTIIEKFEQNTDVCSAIALFTADDLGKDKEAEDFCLRARQNVIFEAGYFMGKLGRSKVIIIAEKDVEIPSDLQGVVYTDKSNWEFDVCRELTAMGYAIDMNKLIG